MTVMKAPRHQRDENILGDELWTQQTTVTLSRGKGDWAQIKQSGHGTLLDWFKWQVGTKREGAMTADEYANADKKAREPDKIMAGWYSFAAYTDKHREAANWQGSNICVLDADANHGKIERPQYSFTADALRERLGQLADKVQQDILAEQKRLNKLFAESSADRDVAPSSLHKGGVGKKTAVQVPESGSNVAQSAVHCYPTQRGDMVRSQPEAVIANALFSQGIDYRYEYPVEGHVRHGIRRPSFLFFDAKNKPILWQHLGPLNDAEQRARWAAKLDWFEANGFVKESNLFITHDRELGSIIRKLTETIKALLTP